jgi:hypothetical protein
VSEETTERLLGELTSGLRPVKRVPPLGLMLGGIFVLWGAHFVALVGSNGLAAGMGVELTGNLAFVGALLGLTISANGGLVGALALGAPGNDSAAGIGSLAAGLGLALALGAGLIGVAVDGETGLAMRSAEWVCLYHAVALALVPGGALLFFMFKGWVARPLLASVVALVASFSVGAVMVHTVCPLFDASHILLGHLGAPVSMIVLGALPLGLAFKRKGT